MRTVKNKGWSEAFFPKPSEEYSAERVVATHNPLRLGLSLVLAGLVIGISNRVGIVLALALVVYLTLAYWRARMAATRLEFARTAPKHATEAEWIIITYEVVNTGALALSSFLIQDRFSGSKDSKILVEFNTPLDPASSRVFRFRRRCDAGMGLRNFGPLVALVTDPLGFFEFRVIEDQRQEIEIFPKVRNLPELPLHGSMDSFLFGLYDVGVRGSSVNFVGVRDYVPGDSLRHISWRLSAHRFKLQVKEFEKVVNTDVTFVVSMDGREHMGQQADSTWEYAKELTLALMSQQVESGNGIQIVSEKLYVPFGRGQTHAHLVSRRIFDLKPKIFAESDQLLQRHRLFFPRGSTLFYLAPVFTGRVLDRIGQLKVIQSEGVRVICILFDAASFIAGKVHWLRQAGVEASLAESTRNLQRVMEELSSVSIPVSLEMLKRPAPTPPELS